MKEIRNPYRGREGYHCFGCSPDNPNGLRMRFEQDGEEVVCTWEPRSEFEGYPGVLHGGIQATLMDEIASWWIFVHRGTAGATARLSVDYRRPVLVSKGAVVLRAALDAVEDNLVTVRVALHDGSGALCSEGRVTYFTYPQALARRRFAYPGREAFAD